MSKNAQHYGTPGGYLKRKLQPQWSHYLLALVGVAVCFFKLLYGLAILSLTVFFWLWYRSQMWRVKRGYEGEQAIGQALNRLSQNWTIFHDVYLGGENADHVVISRAGVFNIESKNYSGAIYIQDNALFTYGQRNDIIVRQAWRQSHKLREHLGVPVTPILVFSSRKLSGGYVGKLMVLSVDQLNTFLESKQDKPALTQAQIKELTQHLRGMLQR